MFKFVIAKDIHGDFVSHVDGCRDLTNRRRVQPGGNRYSGEDVVSAIRNADTNMAAWFGETVYNREAVENCWTFRHTEVAPCLKPHLKGIEFDPETGEPSYTVS